VECGFQVCNLNSVDTEFVSCEQGQGGQSARRQGQKRNKAGQWGGEATKQRKAEVVDIVDRRRVTLPPSGLHQTAYSRAGADGGP